MIGFDGMVMYGIAYGRHSMGGMNGGMESGNMHQDDHGSSSMPHAGMNHGIAWHLMPMISFGGDKLKKLIKLGFQICDDTGCGDGYKISRASHLDMGAGMMIMGLIPTHWFVHAGLMHMIGGDYYQEVHVNSYEKAKGKLELKVPKSISDLETWNQGDTLSYTSRGGTMCTAGVGFTIFCQASGMYMYQNIKKVKYEKIGANLLQVDIARDHKNAEGLLVGTPVTFAMTHVLQHRHRVNTLVFDFSQSNAIEYFRDFISGKLNIRTAQTLRPGISAMHKARNKTGGSMGNTIAGIPFLYQVDKDTMKSHSKSQIDKFLPDSKSSTLTYTAMNATSSNTRGVLSHHKRDHIMFMSMVTELLDPNLHQMGTFKWFYENDQINAISLKEKIAKIGDFYGLTMPSLNHLIFEKKGYARVELDIEFNSIALEKIIQSIFARSPAEIHYSLQTEIEQFFISDANPTRTCSRNFNCQKKVLRQTKNIVEEIFSVAARIENYRNYGKKGKLSKAISELGNLISKNRFTLHFYTNKLQDAGITLSLKGEFFDPYQEILIAEF